jgi:hypothetical protein
MYALRVPTWLCAGHNRTLDRLLKAKEYQLAEQMSEVFTNDWAFCPACSLEKEGNN